MFHKTEGIVLHGLKYGDSTEEIVTVYTEAFGQVLIYPSGYSLPKNRPGKANLLQPLFLLDMEIDHRQGRELQRAREIRTNLPPILRPSPTTSSRSSQAIFLSGIVVSRY